MFWRPQPNKSGSHTVLICDYHKDIFVKILISGLSIHSKTMGNRLAYCDQIISCQRKSGYLTSGIIITCSSHKRKEIYSMILGNISTGICGEGRQDQTSVISIPMIQKIHMRAIIYNKLIKGMAAIGHI